MGDGHLEFGEGESAASAHAAVVFDTWTADNRAEFIDWTGCDGYGFGVASVSTAELAAGLVDGLVGPCVWTELTWCHTWSK